ncbi:MAG: hypothetical protein JHC26_12620, partial [Thermofilum sp.]|uniref:hypothetical protein n=1 Tax=Thermofilum sp. TaxID=1961369 RepID=UPI002589D833
MALEMITRVLLIALMLWINASTFYYVAISNIGIIDKVIVFVAAVLYDMYIMWSIESQRIDKIIVNVMDAELELFIAKTVIESKETYSDLNKLNILPYVLKVSPIRKRLKV